MTSANICNSIVACIQRNHTGIHRALSLVADTVNIITTLLFMNIYMYNESRFLMQSKGCRDVCY